MQIGSLEESQSLNVVANVAFATYKKLYHKLKALWQPKF